MLFEFYASDNLIAPSIDLVKNIPTHDRMNGLLLTLT